MDNIYEADNKGLLPENVLYVFDGFEHAFTFNTNARDNSVRFGILVSAILLRYLPV